MIEDPHGVAALKFFCFPGPAQVSSWHKVAQKPQLPFFPKGDDSDRACNYFFGVACVFITYASDVYDRYAAMDCRHLTEFHERLDAYMFQPAERWSESAVLGSGESEPHLLQNWERLRSDARKVLNDLGEALPSEPPEFDIPALVNLDEFRTTEEARRILE